MGAEHEDLRPIYPEFSAAMEIETEEMLVPSDDDDSHDDNSEKDESGNEEKRNEEEKEDDSLDVLPGTFDKIANDNYRDECEEEESREFSDNQDAESDEDCYTAATGAFNLRPHFDLDIPLLAEGALSPKVGPPTPLPCTPYDFTIPMFSRFWDEDDTTCFCGEWPLRTHCEEAVCGVGVGVWPSQVFLPQVMVWNKPYEHCSSTKDDQARKTKRGRDCRDKRRKVKRLGETSVFMSYMSKSTCHHERRSSRCRDKALRHAIKLRWHRRREADHLQRLTKYFTKAAMQVEGCSCDYSPSQDKIKYTSKRKRHRKYEPRNETDSAPVDTKKSSSNLAQNKESETGTVTKTDTTLSWDDGKQSKPGDPLANWSKLREYSNKTLTI